MKIFLSCVASEFGSYLHTFAAQVRQTCGDQHEIKLREDFSAGSALSEIAAWMRSCDVVIHLVGETFGEHPAVEEVRALFVSMGEAEPEMLPVYSYAQWEYELAQKLVRRTLVYLSTADTPKIDGGVVQSGDEARLQAAHRARNEISGNVTGTFASSKKLNDQIFHALGAAFLFGPGGRLRSVPPPAVPVGGIPEMLSFSVIPGLRQAPTVPPGAASLPHPVIHEQFRCSAFYSERIEEKAVGRIIASIHLESVATEVVREAARRLDLSPSSKLKAGSSKPSTRLSRDSRVDITPDIPGLAFDVGQASVSLWDDQQSVEFRYKPIASAQGQLCKGWIHFWLEGMILADVEVSILVEINDIPDIFREALTEANARPYRFVFPSYSHDDKEVVDRLEAYAESFGDTYLRDIKSLRTGQRWNDQLQGFIRRADIFQLFWSGQAARSKYVESEWQHALLERNMRADPHFLRPIYWDEKPQDIPDELMLIHFARVPLIRAR